jgi:hypothetical protein
VSAELPKIRDKVLPIAAQPDGNLVIRNLIGDPNFKAGRYVTDALRDFIDTNFDRIVEDQPKAVKALVRIHFCDDLTDAAERGGLFNDRGVVYEFLHAADRVRRGYHNASHVFQVLPIHMVDYAIEVLRRLPRALWKVLEQVGAYPFELSPGQIHRLVTGIPECGIGGHVRPLPLPLLVVSLETALIVAQLCYVKDRWYPGVNRTACRAMSVGAYYVKGTEYEDAYLQACGKVASPRDCFRCGSNYASRKRMFVHRLAQHRKDPDSFPDPWQVLGREDPPKRRRKKCQKTDQTS